MLRTLFKPYVLRRFSISRACRKAELENKNVKPTVNEASEGFERTFAPSEYEKTLLVLSGKYKSKQDIPHRISYGTMDRTKSVIRIKLSIILMGISLMVCAFYVWLGKKKESQGISFNTMVKDILEERKQK